MYKESSQHLAESILSVAYRWREMALAITFWFKVDHCFIIMSYDGLVYYEPT